MASETAVVPHLDTPEELVDKKVVEEVKPDEAVEKAVPRIVEDVVTPAEPLPSAAEEKHIETPLVAVVEEEKPVDDAPVSENSLETVAKTVDTIDTPVVEDALKTDDATLTIQEEKPAVAHIAEIEDAAEPVVEEKLPSAEEVTKEPEPIVEPVAAPSVEEVLKADEVATLTEEGKPVVAPLVEEEVIKTEDVAEPVEEEKPVVTPVVEEVTGLVEEHKPLVASVVEEVIETEETAVPVEEEKQVGVPAADKVVETGDTTERIEEEKPVAAPMVEGVTKTDLPDEEDKIAEPAVTSSVVEVIEGKVKVAPEAVTSDVPEPVSEPVDELVEAPAEVVEKSERSLELSTGGQPDNAVPEVNVVPEVPSVESVAAIEEKTEDVSPPETVKEAISALQVPESVKAEKEAVLSELTKVTELVTDSNQEEAPASVETSKEAVSASEVSEPEVTEQVTETKQEETSTPVETSSGRTLAEKLNEEKTTGGEKVEKPPNSNIIADNKEPAAGEKLEEATKPAEPVLGAAKPEMDTKTDRELPTEAETKTAPKQSSNLLSKVKKSLVKAKKAIIGKSPSSKNLPPVTNEDLEVK